MQPTTQADATPAAESAELVSSRRERLRFSDFTFRRSPAGVSSADVELEYAPEERARGHAEGPSSDIGDLRVAADAALRALEQFARGQLAFELVGVKMVRAFDANLVIVSVTAKEEGRMSRLLGCYLADGDTRRGTAIAVLNATNRILGNFIATR